MGKLKMQSTIPSANIVRSIRVGERGSSETRRQKNIKEARPIGKRAVFRANHT